MSIEIKVPQLPESVSDATLVAWHKKVGDSVSRDENLVDLETDKVVLEVPAPASGILKEIKIKDGTTVTAGDLLAVLEEGDVAADSSSAEKPAATTPDSEEDASGRVASSEPAGSSAHKLSPSVRRLLDEHDLDVSVIPGSGKDGRVSKSDVMKYLKSHSDEDVAPGDANAAAPGTAAGVATRTEQRVPMTRLRARIAERLVEAQQSAAMLTTFNEVDLTEVMALRKRYKEPFEKEHGAKLGFMSFFAKAAVEGLKKFPVINASVEGNDIIYHDYYDIGIAVSSERGLMVPIVRDVDQLSFAQVESTIAGLGNKVREGTIGMDDLTGGTFTITNGGIFGSMLSTPILNPPQSAILGMHSIQERPMAVNGEIQIRPMMYLALTYDHRIIDGKEAVQFLVSIKQTLEDPGRLLLQV
ncbi:2-oxoglutarate dehydrogenase complex dihydrolipoyllysine-residue succinyltransferase [Woeseia oceani]|uniref:Dihydrolipoyllysine-residue succinyltransferase component of 2-oxoglutarate dehydrogenase complex n=1 Tax=Woeseia oceani TaxID=1548547 RepID=A0A193LFG8_9GAMM|nr:2-oxoglutarate dehydrogenase complex dihydrolipoyllysine-residue succinyltransferase [Woeseia oceani]ANO51280.1 dihydrolipoamide succinyltransferase [Woeseia oceani]